MEGIKQQAEEEGTSKEGIGNDVLLLNAKWSVATCRNMHKLWMCVLIIFAKGQKITVPRTHTTLPYPRNKVPCTYSMTASLQQRNTCSIVGTPFPLKAHK